MNNHQRDIIIAAGCGDLLRRDWAVRVLDAWADAPYNRWSCKCYAPGKKVWWVVNCYSDQHEEECEWGNDNPNAARLAAAEAVFPELPADVRVELGERP